MTEDLSASNQVHSQAASIKLAQVLGIDVRLHISVVIIFALIVHSLAANLFPHWHPEWQAAQCWSAAFIAGLLFFISLFVHELSHSIVGQRFGIEIESITLFLFGGVAQMRGEPKKPRDEFLIAAAGPLASFVLAISFGMFASLTAPELGTLLEGDELLLEGVSMSATVFMWLATINFMLGAFNLLPGFPMDGGRLFRAALWWRTGDLVKATQMAAQVGSGFGWFFIGLGAMQIFSGNTLNGFWLVLIGWFIRRLALASVASLLLEQALRGFDVRTIMRTRFETVPANLSVQQFVDDYLLRSSQQLWPVTDGTAHVGFIVTANFSIEGPSLMHETGDIGAHMQSIANAGSLSPQVSARDAFDLLSTQPHPLPVVEGGQIIGIIHQADILRWFAFHKLSV